MGRRGSVWTRSNLARRGSWSRHSSRPRTKDRWGGPDRLRAGLGSDRLLGELRGLCRALGSRGRHLDEHRRDARNLDRRGLRRACASPGTNTRPQGRELTAGLLGRHSGTLAQTTEAAPVRAMKARDFPRASLRLPPRLWAADSGRVRRTRGHPWLVVTSDPRSTCVRHRSFLLLASVAQASFLNTGPGEPLAFRCAESR
jgi:hypothetical protein